MFVGNSHQWKAIGLCMIKNNQGIFSNSFKLRYEEQVDDDSSVAETENILRGIEVNHFTKIRLILRIEFWRQSLTY